MRLRIGKQIENTQVRVAALFAGFLLVIAATFGIVNLVSAATVALYTTPVGGTVVTWDGGGADDNFSTDANWDTDTAPVDGDTIVLPHLASADQPLVNDLDGSINLHQVFVAGDNSVNNGHGYTITGNALQIENGGLITISGSSTTLSIATLTSEGDISINGNGSNGDFNRLTITGSATINGTLSTPGTATPSNGGEVNGSFKVTGSLSVDNSLSLATPTTIDAAGASVSVTAGDLSVGAGAGLLAGTVTIAGSGTSTFAGTQTITGALNAANGTLALNSAFTTSAPTITAKTVSVGADISGTTIPSITVTGANSDLTIASPNRLAVTTLTLSDAASELSVNSGAFLTATDVTVNGIGTSTFAGTQNISGDLIVDGTLALNAAFATNAPDVTVDTLDVTGNVSALVIPSIDVTGTAGLSLVSGDNLNVTDLTLSGAGASANLSVASGATLTAADITVAGSGTSTFAGTQTVSGTLTVTNGTLALNSVFTSNAPAVVANTLTVGTDLTAGADLDSLQVTTALTLANSVTVTGALTAGNSLTVNGSGKTVTAGTVVTTGDVTVASGSSLVTTSSSSPSMTVGGNLTTNGTLTSQNVVINGAGASSIASGSTPTIIGTLAFPNGTLTVSRNFVTTAPAITGLNLTIAGTVTSPQVPSITLTGTLTTNSGSNLSVSGDLTADAVTMNAAFTVTGTLTVTGATGLDISQSISAGTLTVSGGDLTVSSLGYGFSAPNVNVTGDVFINAYLNSTVKKYVVSGDMTITNGYVYLGDGTDITGTATVVSGRLTQITAALINLGTLVVNNGASAYLTGEDDFPITFGSGASSVSPSLLYNATASNTVTTIGTYPELTLTGDVTLLNNLSVYIIGNATSGKVSFEGTNTFNGFTITKATGTSGKLFIGGNEVKNAAVTNTVGDNQPAGSLSVDGNTTTVLNGTRGTVSVYNGGNLKGTGKASTVNVYYGGALSPGLSPGTFTVLNNLLLDDSSVYNVELKSTKSYDKTVVGAEHTTCPTTAVSINANAVLAVELYSGYTIGTGDRFTIIDNKSTCAVSGTFKTLPESGIVVAGDGIFSISYVGGDGNDVVLTTIVAPTIEEAEVGVPNTGAQFMQILNPVLLAVAGVAVTIVAIIAVRRRA